MTRSRFGLTTVVLLSGYGALNPLAVDEYAPVGTHVQYYQTNLVVGHARTSNGYVGVFAIGRATMSDTGELELNIFGLSDSSVSVEMLDVRLIGNSPEIAPNERSFVLSRTDRRRIVPAHFSMSSYAPVWPVTIVLTVDGHKEQLELSLGRRRAESYAEIVKLDSDVPRDAASFERL